MSKHMELDLFYNKQNEWEFKIQILTNHRAWPLSIGFYEGVFLRIRFR
jgi:hypothetical protein